MPGAHSVPGSVRLLVSEGNYLLFEAGVWSQVRALFDEVWFVSVGAGVARRLVSRHVAGGMSLSDAEEWVDRSDQANADLVNGAAARADLRVELPGNSAPG